MTSRTAAILVASRMDNGKITPTSTSSHLIVHLCGDAEVLLPVGDGLFEVSQGLVGEGEVPVGPTLLPRGGQLPSEPQVQRVVLKGRGVVAHLLVHHAQTTRSLSLARLVAQLSTREGGDISWLGSCVMDVLCR